MRYFLLAHCLSRHHYYYGWDSDFAFGYEMYFCYEIAFDSEMAFGFEVVFSCDLWFEHGNLYDQIRPNFMLANCMAFS